MAEPADLAGIYLKGIQTRAQIQAENQRLAIQQQEIATRAQQESQARAQQAQQFQQEHDVAQQRIQVEKAYQQQQIDLRKQELSEAEKMNEQKTQSAARQFEARQTWQQGFDKIDQDPTMTEEQKDKAKTSFTMRLAPMMGIPGTEASAMLKDLRPPKPTVPASVEDKGDFWQVTNPTGNITLHPKPKAAQEKDPTVKVILRKGEAPTSMAQSQAWATIPGLDADVRESPVNKAAMAGASSKDSQGKRFSKGKRVRQNNVVYEFDGKDWNPVGK